MSRTAARDEERQGLPQAGSSYARIMALREALTDGAGAATVKSVGVEPDPAIENTISCFIRCLS